MALFPCTVCRKRPKGRANTIYLAVLRGSDAERSKVRLCGDCFQTTEDSWLSRLDKVDPDSDEAYGDPAGCSGCGLQAEAVSPAFATVYAAGAERADYYGYLHDGCQRLYLDLQPAPEPSVAPASRKPK